MSPLCVQRSLPDDVSADKIGATFKNGVLTVTLPKAKKAKKPSKKIKVTPAS